MQRREKFCEIFITRMKKDPLLAEVDVEEIPCHELSDKVRLCWDEKQDWRPCQELLATFRECIELANKQKSANQLPSH